MRHASACLSALIPLLLIGCFGPWEAEPWEHFEEGDTAAYRSIDSDLDGIPDALEDELGEACVIAGLSCEELGILPPEVGIRDVIVVAFDDGSHDAGWRFSDDVWWAAADELARLGIDLQWTELGIREDVDPEATWDDFDWDGRYWFTWLRFEGPDEYGGTGYNEWNLIGAQRHDDTPEDELEQDHLVTLLHELYHAMLGTLRDGQSLCDDEEVGGSGHSSDPDSILYTARNCDQQEDLDAIRLGTVEMDELAQSPFENLAMMNDPSWWA